ncbi:hypothetical protein L3X38_005304 [Prunus dulcis]|uniref:Uncharacterized protein n=1 Tax=Prunus dulcis TaxID=3755 RepID=A0AAD5F441_PRUDU|nr:hypothetical protein L3X38_005304 [Prunus dulcis]
MIKQAYNHYNSIGSPSIPIVARLYNPKNLEDQPDFQPPSEDRAGLSHSSVIQLSIGSSWKLTHRQEPSVLIHESTRGIGVGRVSSLGRKKTPTVAIKQLVKDYEHHCWVLLNDKCLQTFACSLLSALERVTELVIGLVTCIMYHKEVEKASAARKRPPRIQFDCDEKRS